MALHTDTETLKTYQVLTRRLPKDTDTEPIACTGKEPIERTAMEPLGHIDQGAFSELLNLVYTHKVCVKTLNCLP